MKLLIVNGPNLNMLGMREPAIYGHATYEDLKNLVKTTCKTHQIEYHIFQSNHEGALVDVIQAAYDVYDGIIINPAAYTHTSIAILDALKAVGLPAVEVHLSNIHERETFRQRSYAGMACQHTIMGKGIEGYQEAILYLKDELAMMID
ncbi:MAG: type II 3-dehydroquinate dehydratase [Defluviitaleaceae bacterium]|nr:type II 3-dehydroquinate dehydratase [Defluviitaleaceae bacterium]